MDRTPAERDEFITLFTDLIARAYIGQIARYAGETIAYTGERIDGDEASVQSRVVTAKGSHVSLVGTYRSQFDRIIRSESFASLLERLREKGQVAEAR